MIQKILTLQEANGLLPIVKKHVIQASFFFTELKKIKSQKNQLKSRWIIEQGGSDIRLVRKSSRFCHSHKNKIKNLETLLRHELQIILNIGGIVKCLSPIHVDFLSTKENRLVCLCWNGKDPEVSHWHQTGFANWSARNAIRKEIFGPNVVH